MAAKGSLLLVGTGLVGGSFALAAKAAGLFDRVVGVDRDDGALAAALALGVVDETATTIGGEHRAACVAVPVASIGECVRAATAAAPVVFDVGSVKQAVIDVLQPLPEGFVPCHPIAGGSGGVRSARAELFRGRPVVLTPAATTRQGAVDVVRDYWRAVGAVAVCEDARAHDNHFAVLSHLPHLVAFAYMEVAARHGDLQYAGAGFRDFTRIGGADAGVWTDILQANQGAVLERLDELIAALRGFSVAMRGDGVALRSRIEAAAVSRRAFDRSGR